MKVIKLYFQIISLMLLISCNIKQKSEIKDIVIENAYARIIPYAKNGAIYLDIVNNSKNLYKLTSAKTNIASQVEFHLVKYNRNITKMIKQKSIDILPKSTLNFKLANLHLMLINVNQNLQSGDEFKLNLKFNNNLEKTITIKVNNDEINNEQYVEMMHHDDDTNQQENKHQHK